MRETFLDYLDAGNDRWTVDIFESRDNEIWAGTILKNDSAMYPIIRGIPRLLQGDLLKRCLAENQEFTRDYPDLLSVAPTVPGMNGDVDLALKIETIESFGYEWSSFGKMLAEYERNHSDYFKPYGRELFKDKVVLDAGCGTGRHVYYAAKYGAEVVAIDLSSAVEVAYRNTREFASSVHIAQADIYDLPFPSGRFDLVESVGVIHHLPDPSSAFDHLSRLVRSGGMLYAYLYTNEGTKPKNKLQAAKMYFKENLLRPYSRRLPFPVLKTWCYMIALTGRVVFNYPYYLLRRIPGTQDLASKMSLVMYADYPLYVLHTDLFDWIATPVNRFYEKEEVEAFFEERGFENVQVLGDPSWRAFGEKPADQDSLT